MDLVLIGSLMASFHTTAKLLFNIDRRPQYALHWESLTSAPGVLLSRTPSELERRYPSILREPISFRNAPPNNAPGLFAVSCLYECVNRFAILLWIEQDSIQKGE